MRVIRRVLGPLFGPPLRGIGTLLGNWWRRIAPLVAALLRRWANLWQVERRERPHDLGPTTAAKVMLASAAAAIVVALWLVIDPLPFWIALPVAAAVWAFVYVRVRAASSPDSPSRFRPALMRAGERTGLLAWDRLGLVAGLAITVASLVGRISVLPLGILIVAGFVGLASQEHRLRAAPRPPGPPLEEPPPPADSDGQVTVDYRWTLPLPAGTTTHKMSPPIDLATYERLRAENPGRAADEQGEPAWEHWIDEGTTVDVERAAWQLRRISHDRGHSTYAEVSNVLAFVQAFKYTSDQTTHGVPDHWRYPLETLREKCGDCEDTTLLAVAVLRRMGHRVAVLMAPEHAALGVEVPEGVPGTFIELDGVRLYYCETTATGWRVGAMPGEYSRSDISGRLIPL